ncbi:hypothetical protein [Azospirillum sp.]|uniref:hypothetical protein n=1 Tax=Azospirillum sp. TaxID=34012 RepID=UPI002D59E1E0|nr:hypothetical protein [Azospirillum sp.]HYF88773.1 hypothetical protein [Azospirillum sp.]
MKTAWIFPAGLCVVTAYSSISFAIISLTDRRRWEALRLLHAQQLFELVLNVRKLLCDRAADTERLSTILDQINSKPFATYDEFQLDHEKWEAELEILKSNGAEIDRLSDIVEHALAPISKLEMIQKMQILVNIVSPLILSLLSIIALALSMHIN